MEKPGDSIPNATNFYIANLKVFVGNNPSSVPWTMIQVIHLFPANFFFQ